MYSFDVVNGLISLGTLPGGRSNIIENLVQWSTKINPLINMLHKVNHAIQHFCSSKSSSCLVMMCGCPTNFKMREEEGAWGESLFYKLFFDAA